MPNTGLNNKKLGVSYEKWSKRRGFQTYKDLGGEGNFGEQIERAMDTADEIHFNLKYVRVTGATSRGAGELKPDGEPMNSYTSYELYLISTKKKYADKVTWWVEDRRMPDGWWPKPSKLADPR